ncbi:MAG: hypothetical protein VB957_03655 [Pseudomonadales bacterium]
MSVGVWEPSKSSSFSLELVRGLLGDISNIDLEAIADAMGEDFINSNSKLMTLTWERWKVVDVLSDADMETLIRFFTLAEMQLQGWKGGNQNPVIYLVRILKSRDAFTPELRKWIKKNTDNRYLPYGSAL